MPATSAVFLVESIGTRDVAVVWAVFDMSVSPVRGFEELSRIGGGHLGLVGLDLIDRDQRQARVANSLEQAVQRCLVDYRAVDEGGAVGLVGEAEPVKPGGPSGVEVPLEPDFVAPGLVPVAGRWVAHGAPSGVAWLDGSQTATFVDLTKLEGDVMRRDHHMC